jgi:dipeptidyl aminopeptidase/acylaminoacyl peptidase
MTPVHAAPYGSWSSPITPAMLANSSIRLGFTWLEEGHVYWTESRPDEGGRIALMRGDASTSPADVVDERFNVRTRVHEYGGGAFSVHRGTVLFSDFEDQRLYRLGAGDAEPVAITAETAGAHRFADGRVTWDGSTWIGVRERHEGERVPDDVINELVALPVDGSAEPRVIASGRDFYSNARISPDGSTLSWLAWDLPWMPWDGTELFVADLAIDGSLGEPRRVAGAAGEESIWQPSWSPAGELYWASDRSGWWNLERERAGTRERVCPRAAEFGWPQWVFGASSYAFLADGRIACHYEVDGVQHTALLDPTTGELIDLDLPYTAVSAPFLAAEGSTIALIAGAPTIPMQVVLLDVTARSVDVIRESERVEIDPGFFSLPRQIEFPTENGQTAFAHVYLPENPDVEALPGGAPPLIVMSHGGPTAETTPEFSLEIQFWTSRGFAVVDVNYGGSTGYGRAYRQRLNGMWGVVDTADCINAARYLAEERSVDGSRLLIRGASAGGYTTLCALAFHDDFAAGASSFGLADLVPFMEGGTHKFESAYLHTLIGPFPERADVYRARSPINSVDAIDTPMLILQGAEDAVVPPAQAELIVDALERKGLPYAYVVFEGEQHGFRAAASIQRAYEAELSFYAQILGFEPGDPIPRLEIEHLGSG